MDKKQTKTTDKSNLDDKLKDAFSKNMDQPLAKSDTKKANIQTVKDINTASLQTTQKATSGISLHQDAAQHLANLHKNMQVPNIEEPVIPKQPTTEIMIRPKAVPALISSALRVAGYQNPQFHIVANLPGNMSSQIRQLGKELFKSMTKTPVNEITMIGNLHGQGPNTREEVNAVAQFAKQGKDLGDGEIDFSNIMPGYVARVHHFANEGIHFMLVNDDFGDYIYAWPESSSLVSHASTKKLN